MITVKVISAVQCKDRFFHVQKKVEWPAMFPVGTCLAFNDHCGEMNLLNVEGYAWNESTGEVSCDVEQMTLDGNYETEFAWLQSLGWAKG